MSLEQQDAEAQNAGKGAPRVSLDDMVARISQKHTFTLGDAITALREGERPHDALDRYTVCAITFHNGYTVVGKSACVSAANFNAEYEEKLAYEDAIRQAWPLFAFSLADQLMVGTRAVGGDPNA